MGGAFALALWLRLQLLNMMPFSDEGITYYFARRWTAAPTFLRDPAGVPTGLHPWWWFAERPGFYALMTPASWISFEAYRFFYALIASLLPLLAIALLRDRGASPWIAYAAGAVVAVHQQFLVWGAIVHMDTPMTVALAAAVLAANRQRHLLAGGFSLAAIWIKEYALVFVGMFLLIHLATEWRRTRKMPWPLLADRMAATYLVVLSLGVLPFLLASEMGIGLPGGPDIRYTELLFDRLFLIIYLAPLVVLGLVFPRTRAWSAFTLAFIGLLLLLHVGFDRAVREWYRVAPAFWSVVTSLLVIDEGRRRLAGRFHVAWQAAPALAATLILGLVTVQIAADDSPSKREWIVPVSHWEDWSLRESIRHEMGRDANLREALTWLPDGRLHAIFAPDMPYASRYYPLSERAEQVRFAESHHVALNFDLLRIWVTGIEESEVTLMLLRDTPPNHAIREVYRDCVRHENAEYVYIEGPSCPGRFEELKANLLAREKGSP